MAKPGNKVGATRLEMTEERREVFIQALRTNGGNVTAAAATASPNSLSKSNPGYSSFRALMAREPEFASQVQETMDHVRDDVFAEIYRRAMKGVQEPIVQKGEQAVMADGTPAWITRHDNRLLLRLASRLDPAWSEKVSHEHSGTVQHEVMTMAELNALSVEELELIDRALATVGGTPRVIEHSPELPVIDVAVEEEFPAWEDDDE